MLRILIADDHDIVRTGLRLLLAQEYPTGIIETVSNAEEAIKTTFGQTWDVIICDFSMPGKSGLDVVQHMKEHCPQTPVLILSIHPEEQYAIRALKAGAAGYVCKDVATTELIIAVRQVLQGRKYVSPMLADRLVLSLNKGGKVHPHELLSNREFHVFKLLAEGKSVTEIGEILAISITTVSTHRSRILTKTALKSNADLTKYALENSLI